MIKLVIIKNPFEPWNGRELHTVEAGRTADEVLRQYMPACANVDILVNSKPIEPDVVIPDDSFVVIYPKVMGGDSGKNILGTIAMIALSVVSAGIVGSGWAAMGIKAGTFAAYAASAAVMFIGGTLINRKRSIPETSVILRMMPPIPGMAFKPWRGRIIPLP